MALRDGKGIVTWAAVIFILFLGDGDEVLAGAIVS